MSTRTDQSRGLAVVLLNYKGTSDTLACVDSLLRCQHRFDRLIICDNASPDGSLAALRTGLRQRETVMAAARGATVSVQAMLVAETTRQQIQASSDGPMAWVTLVDNQGNWGFAGGNNVGLTLALRDPAIQWFWLLNNDTEVPSDCLGQLLAAAERRPEIDLWAATVVYHDNPQRVQALGGGNMNPRTAETRHIGALCPLDEVRETSDFVAHVEAQMDYALGASMMASRRWLQQVGLLNDTYFLYYEELDWATRGRRLGLRIGYAPKAQVLHKEGATIGTAPDGGSVLSVLHLARSRVLYARQFMRTNDLLRVLSSIQWRALKHLLRGRYKLAWACLKGAYLGVQAGT